jgi:hypothetical protein
VCLATFSAWVRPARPMTVPFSVTT